MRFEAYASACIPDTYTVLGLRLKNLSLGHYLLMKRYGCAYASDVETDIGFSDLVTAVLICSMTFEEALDFFDLPSVPFFSFENLKTFGKAWYLSKKLGGAGYEIRLWGDSFLKQIRKRKEFNIISETKTFQKYITEGSQMPYYYDGDNKADKPSGAHWSLALHSFLLTKYSESEALNLPLRLAFIQYCKWGEENGAIELFQDYEEDMIQV
jgi:hypothetical protein